MRAAGSHRHAIIARPPETARGVAAAESQMAILQREVFLVERLDQELRQRNRATVVSVP